MNNSGANHDCDLLKSCGSTSTWLFLVMWHHVSLTEIPSVHILLTKAHTENQMAKVSSQQMTEARL